MFGLGLSLEFAMRLARIRDIFWVEVRVSIEGKII